MRKDRYTPVDTPKKWGASNDKKVRPIAIDTQKGAATNEKMVRDIAVDTQKRGSH